MRKPAVNQKYCFNQFKQAIFKPIDEEPYTPNNPRGFVGNFGSTGFKKGVLSGESSVREVATFLLGKNI